LTAEGNKPEQKQKDLSDEKQRQNNAVPRYKKWTAAGKKEVSGPR
jgi:hypothetical protein